MCSWANFILAAMFILRRSGFIAGPHLFKPESESLRAIGLVEIPEDSKWFIAAKIWAGDKNFFFVVKIYHVLLC